MTLISKINPKEWKFVTLISLLTLTITIIPLLIGYLMQNDNYRFVGFLSPHEDLNSYLTWMKQAEKGYFLFEIKYTTEEQPRNIFRPYFLFGGLISRYLNIPLVIVYQIMRIISGLILLFTSYIFLAYFIKDILKRKIIFILICFSSGFGYIFATLYHFFGFRLPEIFMVPCDQVHPQAVTFWGIDWFGHTELAIAIMLIIFILFFASYYKISILILLTGLLILILNYIHLFRIFTIVINLGIYSLYLIYRDRMIRNKVIFNYLVLLLFSLIAGFLNLILLIKNPVSKLFIYQVSFYNIFGYLLGMGLVAIVAMFAIVKAIKEHKQEFYFLIIWVISTLILLQSKLPFRMRLVEGLHIALSILCGLGLFWILEKWGWFKEGILNKKGKIFIFFFILFTIPSNLMHFIGDIRTATQIEYPYFLSKDLEDVFNWMDKNLPINGTVLASREIGSFIPARTGLKTYIGHVAETVNKHKKLNLFKQFMSKSTEDQSRIDLLTKNRIDYFLYTDFERKIGDFNPDEAKFLKEIYRSDSVVLYKVELIESK